MITDSWCTTYTNISIEDLQHIIGLDIESSVRAMNDGKLSATGILDSITLSQNYSFTFWDCHRFCFLSSASHHSNGNLFQFYENAADLACAEFEYRQMLNIVDLEKICEESTMTIKSEFSKEPALFVDIFITTFIECLLNTDTIYYWNFLRRFRLHEIVPLTASRVVPAALLSDISTNRAQLPPRSQTISSVLLEHRKKVYSAFIDLHLAHARSGGVVCRVA